MTSFKTTKRIFLEEYLFINFFKVKTQETSNIPGCSLNRPAKKWTLEKEVNGFSDCI